MNSFLFDYILNYRTPKEYRLELKNRLENLCSLSGQTMSPGLTKWLSDTFGVVMVRVIQDYASLSGNKFPPDYFEEIKRIVPGNYKGSDVNQGFRQLFDVTCCDDFYVLSFNDPTWASFTGWTLNGYADFDWGSLAASFGGTYILDFSGIAPPFSPPSQATFIYQGPVPPPDLVGTDAFSNPVSYSFTKYCTRRIYAGNPDFFWTGAVTSITIGQISIDLLNYGGPANAFIDRSNAETVITSALQAYFGPQAYCIITYNPYAATPYYIGFFNIYGDVISVPDCTGVSLSYQIDSSQFKTSSIGSLAFSDIAYDNVTGFYTYASQKITWDVPSTFALFLQISQDPTVTIWVKTSSAEDFSNGEITTTDPSLNGFSPYGDGDFIAFSSGITYIMITSRFSGVDVLDTISFRCPYLGYSSLQSIQNTITS
jgi:hypothetical protein